MKLQVYKDYGGARSVNADTSSPGGDIDLRWMISAVLQHRWMIVMIPLVLVALASTFVVLRPPSYTAATQLQLTNLRLTFIREDAFFAETHPDPSFLETQLQIIRSDRVASSVLNNLKMIAPDASIGDRAKALEELRRSFTVDRAGLSNVVQISYTARDAETAAQIANEFAKAYIVEQNAARSDAAQAGSSWLRERLREVGPKSRVIAEALPPQHKSNLRGIFIIAAAGAIGLGLSVVGAFLWKFLDRRIVTPEEAIAATGVPWLGIIPHSLPVAGSSLVPSKQQEKSGKKGRVAVAVQPATEKKSQGESPDNSFSPNGRIKTFATDRPLSQASQTLRNIKAACQDCFNGKGIRYLAVTSTFPGEGRSTIAANLALSLAASGKRVLLVDSDLYDPALSQLFADADRKGLIEYLRNPKSALSDYVLVDDRTKLDFLPIGSADAKSAVDIWGEGFQRFLSETAAAYDHVIFDMPTLSTLGDIRSAARYLDGFLLVIGWKSVSAESIKVGMDSAGGVSDRLVGTVLNNVDPAELRWVLSPQVSFSKGQRERLA